MNWLIELTKDLKNLSNKKFLLAVSGGMDSMALFHIFLHFRKHFGFNFAVSYYHHGPTQPQAQLDFREQAWELVKKECEKNEVQFFSNFKLPDCDFLDKFGAPLDSEDAMRRARYEYLHGILVSNAYDLLVLAHHKDDLLETGLLRLLRGTGPEGLEAMSFEGQGRLRPLLKVSRQDLFDYLKAKQGLYLEDPSNTDQKYLRNWLRQSWLVDLEKRLPGAKNSLHRSLDLLVSSLGQLESLDCFIEEGELIISELLRLSRDERRRVIAFYMKSHGLKNYGLSHINEVLKRLDREEKSHTFKLLGRCWNVDAGRMSLHRPS